MNLAGVLVIIFAVIFGVVVGAVAYHWSRAG